MEKITTPIMVCKYGLHLASLFLLIFCLLNYKLVFDVLMIIICIKKKMNLFFFFLNFRLGIQFF